MNRLPAQVALEVWALRPRALQFLIVAIIGLSLGLSLGSAVPIMVFFGMLTGSYGFAIAENARLEILYATLPSSRRTVVIARYLVTVGILAGLGVIAVAYDAIFAAVRDQPWSATTSFGLLAVTLAVAAVMTAVQFPFYFALGFTRATPVTWAMSAVGLAGVGILLLFILNDQPLTAEPFLTPWLLIGGPILGLAALTGSAAISVRVYNRKDL